LCIIDSVQSTGVKYASVVSVLDRYRAFRRGEGGDPSADGVPDPLRTFFSLGGDEMWADRIGNRNRTSTRRSAPLKATAIRLAAEGMANHGINTSTRLSSALADPTNHGAARAAWTSVVGQRSGITWHYVQMLAGARLGSVDLPRARDRDVG